MNNPTLVTDTGLNQYGVGCALITQLSLMIKKEIVIIPNDVMVIQVGLEIYNEITQQWEILYTPLGTFYVDSVEEKGVTKSIKAYDRMYKLRKGYFPSTKHTTTYAIANDIANITGLKLKGISSSTNNININNEQLEGKTQIEMLSLLAGVIGGHIRISRDGSSIEFIEPTNHGEVYTESDYTTPTLDDATSYHITKLRINYSDKITNDEGTVTDEGYYEVGTGTDANTLELSHPLLKGQQAQATNVLNKIKQLNGYKRFDTTLRLADYRLEPMDVVTYTKGEMEYIVPILYMKMTLTYRGISIETQSPTVAETKSEFSFKGTLTQKVENIYADIIQVKQLTANKVTTDELEATVATIEKLYVKHGQFDSLVGNSLAVQEINANIANINVLVAGKADISELNAAVANINILNADLATIKHLVAGNISSENIQTGGITSDKLTIANGFIKDAMIDSLNANKITAGQINTALVQVASSSGNLVINDNTIQIRDANRVRVQIGKDASNDYSMSVWDSSGKLMFDARGLKADAIKDSIIRNDMISTNANIDGSKLNINSVVSSINQGSSLLKASKVQIDGVAQTLEVAFNVLKTQADGTKSQTESNTTAISVAQGKINTLIQDTTITKDGQTVKLKDEYSKLEQTVGSLSSTIGKQQTTIDDHSGKITATNSEISSLKQNINGLSASVSSAQTTIQSHTQQLAQKANMSDVDTKINSIQIGGRNYILSSDKYLESMTPTKVQLGGLADWNALQGKTVTVSLDIDVSGMTSASSSTYQRIGYEMSIVFTDGTTLYAGSWHYLSDGDFKGRKSYSFNFANKQIKSINHSGLHIQCNATKCKIGRPKIEIGNKATDWSPAPEDIQASIDAKANSSDVYKKSETYTKSETDSKINIAKDSITQSVASTYETKTNVESKVNGVKSSVTNLESRVNKAEQKITDSAIISTVQNTINTAKTEAINSANSNTANQLKNYSTTSQMNSAINQKANEITSSVSQTYATKGEISGTYATKSELKQTSDSFTFKLENSGGYNVIKNGNALNGQAHWLAYWLPSATWGVRNDEWSGYVPCFQINNSSGQSHDNCIYQNVPTVIGRTYTVSALVSGHRAENFVVVVNGGGTTWITESKRVANGYGGVNASGWERVTATFVATETTMQIRLVSKAMSGHVNNFGWFREVQVEAGGVATNYTPNPEEVYAGITTIDNNGVHVSHTQDGSTSHMGAHGFTHFVGGTNRKYHSLMFCDSIGQTDSWGNVSMRYRLPSEFWGKKFEVLPSLVHVGFDRDVAHAFKNLNISVHDFDHANGYFSITCTPIGVDVNGSWAVNASTSRISFIAIA